MITLHPHGPKPEVAGSGAARGPLWEVLVIAVVALSVRLIHLDALFFTDDYYHLVAAESWLREGTLSIAGGTPYERASLFTYIVAGFMYVFGESSYVARVPVALAGAAWVTLLFVWLRSQAGRTAAWVAALLLCIDPNVISLSRVVRFYTLHGLTFLGVAIGVYHLATRGKLRPRSMVIGLAVFAGFGLSYHLQVTTAVGAMALAVWLLVDLTPRVIRVARQGSKEHLAWMLGIGVSALLLAAVAMVHSGLAAEYIRRFQGVPMWAADRQDAVGFYFRDLRRAYPLLVALSPAAAVVAVARNGRLGIFCVTLFCLPFLVHSLAAFKAERFLAYAMPFFFAIWGMSIAAVLPALQMAAESTVAQVLSIRTRAPWLRLGAGVLLVLIAVGVGQATPALQEAYHLVRPWQPPPLDWRPNWSEARPLLTGPADSAGVLVGTFGPSILYNLGRIDVAVGRNQVSVDNGGEFGEALQLGVPAIAEPESMEILIRCNRSGLVVVDWDRWGSAWGMNPDLISVLVERTQPIPLPSDWRIHAYRWDHEGPFEPQEDCPDLRLGSR